MEQLNISLQFQSNGRSVEKGRTASGNKERDQKAFLELLASCRDEAKLLPPDPNQVPLLNNGNSTEKFQGRIPALEEILDSVEQSTAGQDLAGLFASGPVIRANRNSKGQSHWFSNETFFFDYSLYNGPKAAKGVYAGADWSEETWRKNIDRTKTQLDLLSKKAVKVNPGKYRTYFAPAAFGDLASMMNWKALSAAAWKQGQSPFKKLADGELKLSPLLNVKENFSLGLSPRFNELGEMAPAALPLIEKGELKIGRAHV